MDRRLDDAAIGAMYAVPAYRVTLRRRELGIHRPPAPPPHQKPPAMPPATDLQRWYVTEGQTLERIARRHHTTRETVTTWLQAAEVSVQPRTSREHRKHLDPVHLRELYLVREWSATEIAAELDTSVHRCCGPCMSRTSQSAGAGHPAGRTATPPSQTHCPLPRSGRDGATAVAPHSGAAQSWHHHSALPRAHSGQSIVPCRGLCRDRPGRWPYRATPRATIGTHPAVAAPSRHCGPGVRIKLPWLRRQRDTR